MNMHEVIDLYFQEEANVQQIRLLEDWLLQDINNVRTFIREANTYKNIIDCVSMEKQVLDDYTPENNHQVSAEDLELAAGGNNVPNPTEK